MTIYIVTTSIWNDPAFWATVNETGTGHTLDFSNLPSNFDVDLQSDFDRIIISDGVTSFTIGDSDVGFGTDATMGGTTQLEYFTTIIGSQGDTHAQSSDTADTLLGASGSDTFEAGRGADSIDGGAGNDSAQGGQGDDTLVGGDGADELIGDGQWYDPVEYASSPVSSPATNLTVTNSADGPIDLWYIDTSGTPVFYQTIQPGATYVQPTFENHNWLLRDEDGYYLELIEGAPNQTIDYGLEGLDDSIDGDAGNDTLLGLFGADTINGGTGNDSIEGGYGDDLIDGGTGNDTVNAGAGSDTILLSNGYSGDSITAGEDTDGADRDVLDASGITNDGVDVFLSGSESGNVTSTEGTANFVQVEDFILTNQADTFQGTNSSANMQVDGGGGDDALTGGSGNDTLIGGTGNDTLTGRTGDDSLTGGAGDDVFTYTPGDGLDTITDFNAGISGTLTDGVSTNNDFIDLSSYYDHLSELWADQLDDGVLNQSNATDLQGTAVNYADNTQFNTDSIAGNEGISFTGASADAGFFNAENTGVVCFAAGTLIATDQGAVPVEHLSAGDLVLTMDNGLQPLRWTASRSLSAVDLAEHPNLRPIRISPKALGRESAEDDLIVSPQHRILVSSKVARRMFGEAEVLVAAKQLLAMDGVEIEVGAVEVTYFHLLFDAHEILFANGVPAESLYLGTQVQKALSPMGRAEIYTLFPEVSRADFMPRPCRMLVSGHQARRLCWRHAKNQKPVLATMVERPATRLSCGVQSCQTT